MARAVATCTCKYCGTEFEKTRHGCYNRKAAEMWQEWAEKNLDECPECYRERRAEEREEAINALGLPKIEGASEKQIAYAADLRKRYVVFNMAKIARVKVVIEQSEHPSEDFLARMKEIGKTPEQALQEWTEGQNLEAATVCVRATNAHTIIEALKDKV